MTVPQAPDARSSPGRPVVPPPSGAPAAPGGASAPTKPVPGGTAPTSGPAAGTGTAPTGTAAATGTGATGTGATAVLPTSSRRPPPRPAAAVRGDERSSRPAARSRKARLALKRIDPWSVFVFSLIASVLLGIALVAAVAALYAVLDSLGVQSSVNQLFDEVTGGGDTPLITTSRVVGGAAVLAAVNVVLLTLLATLGALLYNLCASFTGGVELTLGEREG